MALTFMKAGQKAQQPAASPAATQPKATPKSSPSFLKSGAAAREAFAAEEAKAELAKQEAGKMWRFWIPQGEDRRITFLDGDLDDDGMLAIGMFHEHRVMLNGNWQYFICTAEADQTQPCPICEAGDKPAFAGVMTIIDHTPHHIKKGPNAGKVIVNQRKLFVARRNTIKQLTKLATKRGGLAGCSFDVSRTGEREPGVGNQFDFVEKFESYEQIAQKFDIPIEQVQPADYTSELSYRSPEELIELGVGKAVKPSGGQFTSKASGDVADQL